MKRLIYRTNFQKFAFLRRLTCIFLGCAAAILVRPQKAYTEEVAADQDTSRSVVTSVHPAVLRAPVLVERSVAGAAENGGDLVIRRIAEPVLTPEELAAAVPVPAKPLTVLEKAARQASLAAARLAGPLETRLFSPEVLLFPEGVALIRWWSVDASRQFEAHGVWVSGVDFSLLPAVNELNVGRRRWLVTACSVRDSSSGKLMERITPPSPADFSAVAEDAGVGVGVAGPVVLVEEGDGAAGALEPLTALVTELRTNAEKLAGVIAARKIAQQQAAAEAAARAKLSPAPSVIRFWTSDADEVRTLSRSLPVPGVPR